MANFADKFSVKNILSKILGSNDPNKIVENYLKIEPKTQILTDKRWGQFKFMIVYQSLINAFAKACSDQNGVSFESVILAQDLSIDKLDQLKHLADKKCLLEYLMLMLDSKIALQNRYLLAFVEELEFSQRLAQDDQQRDDEEEITEKMLEDQFNYGTQLARVASTGTEYYYMKKTKKYISDYYPTFLHKIKVEFEAIDENATKNMDELGSVAVDLTLQMLKLKIYVAQDGFHIGKLNVFKTEDFLKIEKKVNEEIQELRNYPITEKPKVEKPDFSIINI